MNVSTELEKKKPNTVNTNLTSSSSSPTNRRPSLPAAPLGSIPTTKTLMRERSLFPAKLRPRPVLPFSSSIMCRTPGRLPYRWITFSERGRWSRSGQMWADSDAEQLSCSVALKWGNIGITYRLQIHKQRKEKFHRSDCRFFFCFISLSQPCLYCSRSSPFSFSPALLSLLW